MCGTSRVTEGEADKGPRRGALRALPEQRQRHREASPVPLQLDGDRAVRADEPKVAQEVAADQALCGKSAKSALILGGDDLAQRREQLGGILAAKAQEPIAAPQRARVGLDDRPFVEPAQGQIDPADLRQRLGRQLQSGMRIAQGRKDSAEEEEDLLSREGERARSRTCSAARCTACGRPSRA